ncbi:MAG: hypothetical protein IT168_24450 [Bryobacterales bacterium]|nr:hypothetical protein [Bryobacterales bacterium]
MLLLFSAFLVFAVSGLRNRPGPRWLAISGMFAIPMVVASDWWRISANCYSKSGLVSTCVWLSAVTGMFLHHAFQPRAPVRTDPRGPATRRQQINHFVHRSALPSFLITLLTWALLNQFRALTYDGDNPNRIHGAIIAVQQLVAWAAAALFVVAVAVGLHALISQLRTVDT